MKIIGKRVIIILIIFMILFGTIAPTVFADPYNPDPYGINPASNDVSFVPNVSSSTAGDVLSSVVDFGAGILLYPIRLVIMVIAQTIETLVGVSGSSGSAGAVVDSVSTTASSALGVSGAAVTAESILFNDPNSALTNINFFEKAPTGSPAFVSTLRTNIAGWYYGIRTIAIILSLAVLIYIAIRMVTSSIADDRAKYKNMLKDWAVSFAIVFLLHYVIILVITGNNILVEMLKGSLSSSGAYSSYVSSIKTMAVTNLTATTGFSAAIVWLMLEGITLAFFVMYVKRVIVTAFLIIISPLVTITYAIDKIGDGKAQAFSNWGREFVWTVLIQPFHCLIYLVFMTAAIGLLQNGNLASSIVAIMCMLFILNAESIVKNIFGIASSEHMGGIGTGAALAVGGMAAGARMAGGAVAGLAAKGKGGNAGGDIKTKPTVGAGEGTTRGTAGTPETQGTPGTPGRSGKFRRRSR